MKLNGKYRRRPRESRDSGLVARREGASLRVRLMRRRDDVQPFSNYLGQSIKMVGVKLAVLIFQSRYLSRVSNFCRSVLLEAHSTGFRFTLS